MLFLRYVITHINTYVVYPLSFIVECNSNRKYLEDNNINNRGVVIGRKIENQNHKQNHHKNCHRRQQQRKEEQKQQENLHKYLNIIQKCQIQFYLNKLQNFLIKIFNYLKLKRYNNGNKNLKNVKKSLSKNNCSWSSSINVETTETTTKYNSTAKNTNKNNGVGNGVSITRCINYKRFIYYYTILWIYYIIALLLFSSNTIAAYEENDNQQQQQQQLRKDLTIQFLNTATNINVNSNNGNHNDNNNINNSNNNNEFVIDRSNNNTSNNQSMKYDSIISKNDNNNNSNGYIINGDNNNSTATSILNNSNNNNNNNNNSNNNNDINNVTNTINIITEAIKVSASLKSNNEQHQRNNDNEIYSKNITGNYIGAPCELTCDSELHHVVCASHVCSCENNYPVIIDPETGCGKPKKLGEQCFYHQTCMYNDENSLCVQINHNAICKCADGYHSVSYSKPFKRVFCTQDIAVLTSNLPTLLGVTTGIAVLAGLICLVLHLFSKTKYPRHRNFGNANIPPPVMYSSDTGIPLTTHSGRPSSRSSVRSSGSTGSYGNRRYSNNTTQQVGSKGVLVSTSRTGSRRPSLISIHSTSSSVKSYSMLRFEKELQQKEIRQEMKQRLVKLQQQQQQQQNKPLIIVSETLLYDGNTTTRGSGFISTPTNSLTPNSTDELLPSLEEVENEKVLNSK